MNVKNIKSFIEFYEFLGVSTFITPYSRNSKKLMRESNYYLKLKMILKTTKILMIKATS